MVSDTAVPPPFTRHGPAIPIFPVVISVPHAGRHYPSSLVADAAVPLSGLRLLEDRHADLLVARAVERGATIFVAQHARALIDLNRDPREIDARMIADAPADGLILSSRARHGLGLVPRHVGNQQLWRQKFPFSEIVRRIDHFHRPYHDAIAAALAAARARFGIAVLIDCHSMPPLKPVDRDTPPPAVVIGDRFGRSADATFSDLIENIVQRAALRTARNAPYAGGYSLDLHGAPRRRIHALQVEIDRSCYLDQALDKPGPGLPETQALIGEIFDLTCEECQAIRGPIAAE